MRSCGPRGEQDHETARAGHAAARRATLDCGAAGQRSGVLRLQAHGLELAYLRHWAVVLSIGALLQRAVDEAGLPGV